MAVEGAVAGLELRGVAAHRPRAQVAASGHDRALVQRVAPRQRVDPELRERRHGRVAVGHVQRHVVTVIPSSAAHALTSRPSSAAASMSGKRSGVQAKTGAPSAATWAASSWS